MTLPAVADVESMEFLRFVISLSEALNIDIPKSDYWRLTTLEGCAEYLAA